MKKIITILSMLSVAFAVSPVAFAQTTDAAGQTDDSTAAGVSVTNTSATDTAVSNIGSSGEDGVDAGHDDLTVSNIGSSGEDGVSDDGLTVSNIGSSGEDGVDAAGSEREPEIEGFLDIEGSDESGSGHSPLEIEVDVFFDITTIKVEDHGRKTYFETDLKDRAALIVLIAEKLELSPKDVEAVIMVEHEDRASRPDDRDPSATDMTTPVDANHNTTRSNRSTDAHDVDSDGDGIDDSNRSTPDSFFDIFVDIDVSRRDMDRVDDRPEIRTSTDVRTKDDLRVYVETLVSDENHIEEVETREDEVRVTTHHRARLFGFIPVKARAQTHVSFEKNEASEIQSRVKVRFPWWKFLARVEEKTAETTEAEVKTRLDKALETRTEVDAEVYAEILASVEAILGTNAE